MTHERVCMNHISCVYKAEEGAQYTFHLAVYNCANYNYKNTVVMEQLDIYSDDDIWWA